MGRIGAVGHEPAGLNRFRAEVLGRQKHSTAFSPLDAVGFTTQGQMKGKQNETDNEGGRIDGLCWGDA